MAEACLSRKLIGSGKGVFLDLKLHDIPTTVEKAYANVARLGARYLTVHAYPQTMAAAARGAAGSGLKILGVTVLTSCDDADLKEAGFALGVEALVARRAGQARAAGIDGLILSAAELEPSTAHRRAGPDPRDAGHQAGRRGSRGPEAGHNALRCNSGGRRSPRRRASGHAGGKSPRGGRGDPCGNRQRLKSARSRSRFSNGVGDDDRLRDQAKREKGVGDFLLLRDDFRVDRLHAIGLPLQRDGEDSQPESRSAG